MRSNLNKGCPSTTFSFGFTKNSSTTPSIGTRITAGWDATNSAGAKMVKGTGMNKIPIMIKKNRRRLFLQRLKKKSWSFLPSDNVSHFLNDWPS